MQNIRYKLTRNITQSVSHKAVQKNWILIDATDLIVGRLSAFLVNRLKGKHLPSYTPNIDGGDNIIIINCAKVALSGKKNEDKLYRHHTGWPSGMTVRTAKEVRNSADPCDLIRLSVKRMLGKGPMAYKRLGNLHLYPLSEHKHQAQTPKIIDFKALNIKNSA